jgi:vacuolar-type H+-ATPase subunit E/Vma4
MRRDEDFFADKELALIYIAKKLKEALAIEEILTRAEFDYLVEPDKYRGGVLFVSERIGAFFYVDPSRAEQAREFLAANGYKPWQPA